MAHVVEGLDHRGASLLVEQLLASDGGVVHDVVMPVNGDPRLVDSLQQGGITVHSLARLAAPSFRGARALRSLFVEQRPDIVHVHASLAAAGVRLAVRSMPDRLRPVIVHPDAERDLRHLHLHRRAARSPLRLDDLDRAIASSEGESLVLGHEVVAGAPTRGVDVAAIRLLRGARDDVRTELGIAPDARVVGVVVAPGRDRRDDLWIDIADAVCDASADVHFVVLGVGPPDGAARGRRCAAGHRTRIHVPPPFGEPGRLMSACDLLVVPDGRTGLSVMLLEGLALGLPVVAAAVDGITDAVRHGVEGLLVAPGDRLAFVTLVEALLDDPARRARFAAAAATRAEAYDTARALAELESRYRALAALRANAPGARRPALSGA